MTENLPALSWNPREPLELITLCEHPAPTLLFHTKSNSLTDLLRSNLDDFLLTLSFENKKKESNRDIRKSDFLYLYRKRLPQVFYLCTMQMPPWDSVDICSGKHASWISSPVSTLVEWSMGVDGDETHDCRWSNWDENLGMWPRAKWLAVKTGKRFACLARLGNLSSSIDRSHSSNLSERRTRNRYLTLCFQKPVMPLSFFTGCFFYDLSHRCIYFSWRSVAAPPCIASWHHNVEIKCCCLQI